MLPLWHSNCVPIRCRRAAVGFGAPLVGEPPASRRHRRIGRYGFQKVPNRWTWIYIYIYNNIFKHMGTTTYNRKVFIFVCSSTCEYKIKCRAKATCEGALRCLGVCFLNCPTFVSHRFGMICLSFFQMTLSKSICKLKNMVVLNYGVQKKNLFLDHVIPSLEL